MIYRHAKRPSKGIFRRLAVASALLVGMAACDRIDGTPRNVLIVSIDTLRADHLGSYGATTAHTPNIDRIATEGVQFDSAFSPAPLTLPSHSTLLTGLDPYRHGVRHNGIHRLDDAVTTLAELFSAAGYATGAAVGSLVLGTQSGLDQGFDYYEDELPRIGDHDTAQRRADAVNSAAMKWLEAVSQPFFLFVHYYDPHRPFDPPQPYSESARTPYDGEISYADAMFGALLEDLERRDMLDETIVILTSDHGEGLGEHDELTHGYAIYDATQHVPLIIRGPNIPASRRIRGVVRTADIAPTVLSLAHLVSPVRLDGSDLAPLWRDEPSPDRFAYLESLATRFDHGWSALYGIRSNEHLYIRAPVPELYDVVPDPTERMNRLSTSGAKHAALVAEYERELDRRLRDNVTVPREDLDEATVAQLRALGYAVTNTSVTDNGLDPKRGRPSLSLYHAGDAAYAAGRFAEAAERYEEMLALSPSSGEAWFSLGAARLNQGAYRFAYEASLRATEEMPKRSAAWLQLGITEMALDRPAKAVSSLRRAIALDPAAPGGHLRLLKALVMQGKLSAAQDHDEKAARHALKDEVGLRRLADFWESEGQDEIALSAYQRVLAIAPASQRDHLHAAIALIRLGRVEEARPHLSLSGNVPTQPKARRALAIAYAEATRSSPEAKAARISDTIHSR